MGDTILTGKLRQKIQHDEDANSFWNGFEYGAGMGDRYAFYDHTFTYYDANDWTQTETQAATDASIAVSGGALRLPTVGDTENDVTAVQLGEAAGTECFVPTAGKKIYFGCQFRCDEATQVDILIGLADTDTGIPAARPSDGLFFWKGDGGTGLDFFAASSSTESSETGLATFSASTWTKVQFRVTGTNLVEYWVDDVRKGSITTNIPTTELRISMGQADGDGTGGADNLDIRNVYCYQER